MKKLLIAMGLCLMATPGFALLSPINQSIREIQTMVTSPEVPENFGQIGTIQEIKREGNSFTLKTQEKEMVVDIIYSPAQRPGPRPFKLVFHPATPIKQTAQ